jgi:hypothetical protein
MSLYQVSSVVCVALLMIQKDGRHSAAELLSGLGRRRSRDLSREIAMNRILVSNTPPGGDQLLRSRSRSSLPPSPAARVAHNRLVP